MGVSETPNKIHRVTIGCTKTRTPTLASKVATNRYPIRYIGLSQLGEFHPEVSKIIAIWYSYDNHHPSHRTEYHLKQLILKQD